MRPKALLAEEATLLLPGSLACLSSFSFLSQRGENFGLLTWKRGPNEGSLRGGCGCLLLTQQLVRSRHWWRSAVPCLSEGLDQRSSLPLIQKETSHPGLRKTRRPPCCSAARVPYSPAISFLAGALPGPTQAAPEALAQAFGASSSWPETQWEEQQLVLLIQQISMRPEFQRSLMKNGRWGSGLVGGE